MSADDEKFLKEIARATVGLIAAHEIGPEAAVLALRTLLNTIAKHGTIETRRAEALRRAIERL